MDLLARGLNRKLRTWRADLGVPLWLVNLNKHECRDHWLRQPLEYVLVDTKVNYGQDHNHKPASPFFPKPPHALLVCIVPLLCPSTINATSNTARSTCEGNGNLVTAMSREEALGKSVQRIEC